MNNDQYQNRNRNQSQNQKSSLVLLNMIHKTFPTIDRSLNELPVLFNTGMIDFNKDNAQIFGGRNVIRVDRMFPFKVSKRLIKPQFTSDGYFGPNSKIILKKMFRVDDLSKILLLITSTAAERRQSEEYVLHGYEIETEVHLGLTVVSRNERKLIEREHNVHNYSLIFCTGYIELEDAYKKTPIRDKIFQVLRDRPLKDICVWNGDNTIILHYQYSGAKPKNMIIWKRTISPLDDKSPSIHSAGNTLDMDMQRQAGGQDRIDPLESSPDLIKKSKKRKRRKRKTIKENVKGGLASKIGRNEKPIKREVAVVVKPQKIIEPEPEPEKKKRKPRKKRVYLVPNADLDPEQRKALYEKFYKERQRRRERKWNRFHNGSFKRQGI